MFSAIGKNKIISISVSVLLSVLICIALWCLLSFVIPIDELQILSSKASFEYYRAPKGWVGFWLLLIIDFIISLIIYKRGCFKELNEEESNFITKEKVLKGLLWGLRLSVSIYLIIFSINNIIDRWFTNADFVFEINSLFAIWPIFYVIASVITLYLVVFLSWQIQSKIMTKCRNKPLGLAINPIISIVAYSLFVIFSYAKFPISSSPMIIAMLGFLFTLILFQFLDHRLNNYEPLCGEMSD